MTGQWYEEFFDKYGERYDKEPFTQGTRGEVDFIEEEMGYDRSKKILDIGCGTGRHSLELARRGYRVVGVDLSKIFIEKAKRVALEEHLSNVTFIESDARDINFENEFDVVLSICEGAFSLMETDRMNFKILENIWRALRDDGKLILTTLSAVYALTHKLGGEFDVVTFRERSTMEVAEAGGRKKLYDCEQRFYAYTEINWLLRSLGFRHVAFFGCKLGAFSRERKPSKDDFEMLVVADK
jgi:SAM-dependent methyltransferase